MKVIIQNVKTRNIDDLLKQIPNAVVHIDKFKDPNKAFVDSLKLHNGEDVLKLEDDIELTSNFMYKVLAARSVYPDRVINFFTLKKTNEIKEMAGRTFCSGCCFYIPNRLMDPFFKFYNKGWKREKEHPTGFDLMFADFLTSIKEKYILWDPSLVQHKQVVSSINKRRSKYRQAKNFKK